MKRMMFALAVLGLMLCAGVVPLAAQDDLAQKRAEGKKIWDKWMAARGGRDRLMAVKEIQATADVRVVAQGINLTLVTYKKGLNKYRQDQKVMGTTIIQAINGEQGWMTDPASGSIVDMPKNILGQLSAPANEHEALLDPEKFGHVVTYEGRKSILAKEYILLNQRSPEGVVATHYIDPDTFLRYKYAWVASNVPTEVIESDYRDVDGVKVPFLMRQIQNGNEAAIIAVKEYKFNAGIPDSIFDRNAQLPGGRKEIVVAPEILAKYVGTYELKPGFDLVVTLEGDKLFTQATGQGKVQVFPETETKFFLKVTDAQIEFLKDDKGAITHLMLDQGPAHVKAPRK